MTFPNRESLLYDPVFSYVRRRGFNRVKRELAFYEHRIDIYGFSESRDLTAAVELKVRKWRTAYHQSLLYQLCADLVYIAIPAQVVPRLDIQILKDAGVGVIAVHYPARCRLILAPKQSPCVRPHYREIYIEMLRRDQPCPRPPRS